MIYLIFDIILNILLNIKQLKKYNFGPIIKYIQIAK